MSRALTPTQILETLRVPQDLATLLAQRGELSGEFVLPGHTDREDLLGFFPSRRPAEGRQAKGDASRILGLAHLATPKSDSIASELIGKPTSSSPRRFAVSSWTSR